MGDEHFSDGAAKVLVATALAKVLGPILVVLVLLLVLKVLPDYAHGGDLLTSLLDALVALVRP